MCPASRPRPRAPGSIPCRETIDVVGCAEFGRMMFNNDAAPLNAFTVHVDQTLHRLLFGRRGCERSAGPWSRHMEVGLSNRWPMNKTMNQRNDEGAWDGGRFAKKTQSTDTNDPILKDTRTWLAELRRRMRDELRPARRGTAIDSTHAGGMEGSDGPRRHVPSLREGLEGRAFRLLNCTDKEWLGWLDNLNFWKAGWKPGMDDENEA